MIEFNKLWNLLSERGITASQLRKQCGFDPKIIHKLEQNKNVELKTLDIVCTVLSCKLEDIAEYKKD